MDGAANSNDGSTPPPPPPSRSPSGQSPKTLETKLSPGRRFSGMSGSGSGLPPRRPQLGRDGFMQRSFAKRERTSSTHSQGDSSRVGSLPRPDFEEHFDVPSEGPPTDARLILASLEREPVEDEAEATLLDVLERRQRVTFAIQAAVPPPSHHRRGRSYATGGALPNIDLMPSSAEAVQQPLSRPALARGLSSSGRSKRNLLQGSPPPISGRVASAPDWAFDAHGQLLQNLSGLSNPEGAAEAVGSGSPSDAINKAPSHDSEEGASPNIPAHRHHRSRSTLPGKFERGVSNSTNSSGPSGLTTPGERARYVALAMKIRGDNTIDETLPSVGEAELSDLVNVLETQRDNDEQRSTGSTRKSGRASQSRNESRSGRSRLSEHRSMDAQSKSSKSSGYRTNRPFAGISSAFANDGGFTSNVEALFEVAEHVQELCQIPEGEEDDDRSGDLEKENKNFLSNLVASHPEVPPAEVEGGALEEMNVEDGGAVDEHTPILQQGPRRSPRIAPPRNMMWSLALRPSPETRFYKVLLWVSELRKQTRILAAAFDFPYVKERLWSFIQNDVSMIIVPALAVAAVLYYSLDNPAWRMFKTGASVSWVILFLLRHYLTLQLAYTIEYTVVDVMAMRSLVSVQLIGPLATLYTINSKGWPFVFTTWGLLNLLLIQEGHHNGSQPFFSHWLYFTDIDLFSDNPSGGIVQTDLYRNILASMVIAGIATSIKRTVLALYLGKRIYIHYKPKLEKVMESMILITEVADLGDAIDDFDFEKVDSPCREVEPKSVPTRVSSRQSTMLSDTVRAATMKNMVKQGSKSDSDEDSDDDGSKEESGDGSSTPWNRLRGDSISSDENEALAKDSRVPSQEALDKESQETRDKTNEAVDAADPPLTNPTEGDAFGENLPAMEDVEPPISAVKEPVSLLREKTTTGHIRSLLDDWQEPVNKQDKLADPTIHEILQFRKALSFLDDTMPFGSSFGPAFTRNSCIKSSKDLYKRLLALSPGEQVLHFDILGVLAYNVDGSFDEKKAKGLVRLFRPGKNDEVTLLAFTASCDGVYKKLRYLRASVGNSTSIDSVLEKILNGAFYFFLALVILTVLNLKPWTLLAAMSTVLVSFAFALGPSAAKIIEGMIMIAVRRPFDLGDRISIVETNGPPDNNDDPGYHDTWIVEDCNLFTTTLRLSRTNEVSTVNNGAIAYSRIVNHCRSPHALVNVSLRVNIAATHEQIQIVKSALQQTIQDHPRIWSTLVNFRITKVDPANNLIVYSARVQHVRSWQDLLPVLQARGDLEKFLQEILMKLGIQYWAEVNTQEVWIKELPDQQLLADQDTPFPDEAVPDSESMLARRV